MSDRVTWIANGNLITPRGTIRGAAGIQGGRIVDLRPRPAAGSARINVRGAYIAPGLIDLHIWGDPSRVAREEVRYGTTGFLTAIGPEPPELLVNRLVRLERLPEGRGARCLGVHLEGPFLNPIRAGALASRWLRPPTSREVRQLVRAAGERLRLVTLAPEIPRGLQAVRWLTRHQIVVAIGHSDADAEMTQRAIQAGARAVTHVYNGMRPLHHRDPGLLGEVLTEDRLMAMAIVDGVHVDPVAFQLLMRCKGPDQVILVTDSIRHQAQRPPSSGGAYYARPGVLAGSRLTMIGAVRNAVRFGRLSVEEAVRMASLNPARLLGRDQQLGSLTVGKQADVVVFNQRFQVTMTFMNGALVYQRKRSN